jgi:hypothetical protein
MALIIDRTKTDQDSIDKKIQSLQKDPLVSGLSINHNYIYIVPKPAKETYQASLGIVAPDPAEQTQIDQNIRMKIGSLGIDLKTYDAIITD